MVAVVEHDILLTRALRSSNVVEAKLVWLALQNGRAALAINAPAALRCIQHCQLACKIDPYRAPNEAGLDYEVETLAQGDQKKAANVARQPFGQVPVIENDGKSMFESGAIVWRIAEASITLLPKDQGARDRVFSWHFAALNTVEPEIMMLAMLDFFASDKEAAARLRPDVIDAVQGRLNRLSDALEDRDWLVGDRFTVADLMMATVLRILKHTDIVAGHPTLDAYLLRCTDRPAFVAALDAQLQTFSEHAAKYVGAA